MQINLNSQDQAPLVVEVAGEGPNISLYLRHSKDTPAVAEVFIDYFEDTVKVVIAHLDRECEPIEDYHFEEEPSTVVTLTEKWSEYDTPRHVNDEDS